MAGILGLMKEGDAGSDTSEVERVFAKGGCMESPFIFRGRRGPGEVMGRTSRRGAGASETVRLAIDGNAPKDEAGKALRGTRLTGESGEDDGDGSDSEDESVHETVVVGDESADSEG